MHTNDYYLRIWNQKKEIVKAHKARTKKIKQLEDELKTEREAQLDIEYTVAEVLTKAIKHANVVLRIVPDLRPNMLTVYAPGNDITRHAKLTYATHSKLWVTQFINNRGAKFTTIDFVVHETKDEAIGAAKEFIVSNSFNDVVYEAAVAIEI